MPGGGLRLWHQSRWARSVDCPWLPRARWSVAWWKNTSDGPLWTQVGGELATRHLANLAVPSPEILMFRGGSGTGLSLADAKNYFLG